MPVRAERLEPAAPGLTEVFRDFDVVMLGEVHDNPLHHAVQARLVAALRPSAIVFEMIRPDQARAVTPELRQDAIGLEAALMWEARGWPDFAMYYPIFAAAPEAGIFGAALPREAARQAVADGAAGVFGAGSALFGLDQPLEANQQERREALQMAAHCDALPESVLPGMVEAQRLRDAGLARAVVNALAQGGDGPVVVIAGNGHLREDWGAPHVLRVYLAATGQKVRIATLGQFEKPVPAAPEVTHWIVTRAAKRDDPCAGFR